MTTKKRILVTGSSGYIGSRFCKYVLQNKHYSLVTISRKFHNDLPANQYLIKKYTDIEPSFFEDVDCVVHSAGYAHDLSDEKHGDKYFDINLEFTKLVFEMAKNAMVKKFIFLSSVKVNQSVNQYSIKENDSFPPTNIYGISKLAAENFLLSKAKETNTIVTIIRPSLVYGPEVKGNLFRMLSAIKKGFFPPLPNIESCKSMVHIDDLVKAIDFCIVKSSTNNNIYHITDGQNYSAQEIYHYLLRSLNMKVPNWHIPKFLFFIFPKTTKIRRLVDKIFGYDCFCSSKIRKLGFFPKKTLEHFNETDY